MPDSRSRSHSPEPRREGRRSRSPRRSANDRGRKRSDKGFRWKEKRRGGDEQGRREDSRLERGYRSHHRGEHQRNDQDRERSREGGTGGDGRRERDKGKKASGVPSESKVRDVFVDAGGKQEKAEKGSTAPGPPAEPTIIVHVNDRLGTKAAIPCLASDPIKLFKALVAAHIGREPHEILLKRQGERPFKDQLTLEDYGVSNGVQIDLEVDTGA